MRCKSGVITTVSGKTFNSTGKTIIAFIICPPNLSSDCTLLFGMFMNIKFKSKNYNHSDACRMAGSAKPWKKPLKNRAIPNPVFCAFLHFCDRFIIGGAFMIFCVEFWKIPKVYPVTLKCIQKIYVSSHFRTLHGRDPYPKISSCWCFIFVIL